MTQDAKRKPADVLRDARRRDSDRKRDQVFRAVDAMKREGTPITFASVARSAKVSQWLVYAEGVREYIVTARDVQAAEPLAAERAGQTASETSLRTDLALAKQDNRRLRVEVDRLKCALRERLGTQLEVASAQSLQRRIDELTQANDRYRSENARLALDLNDTHQRLQKAEDDLGAVRTSLRRMIRERSAEPIIVTAAK
ncbi:hypothetical protein [Mycobacterium sp.]|uniref:hypothetical protein n=1 Tax=Mycobacterium sp. TaxID=1785 RepID=UPI003F9D8F9F